MPECPFCQSKNTQTAYAIWEQGITKTSGMTGGAIFLKNGAAPLFTLSSDTNQTQLSKRFSPPEKPTESYNVELIFYTSGIVISVYLFLLSLNELISGHVGSFYDIGRGQVSYFYQNGLSAFGGTIFFLIVTIIISYFGYNLSFSPVAQKLNKQKIMAINKKNNEQYQLALNQWNNTWYCHQCGKAWISE